MNIGGVEIGPGYPCRFVAEISNTHTGDRALAFALIDAAKAIGADFVKFQCYTASELIQLRGDGPAPEPWGAQGWTMRTLYEKAATPLEWFPALFQYARDVGIVPFSSVFGLESLVVLEKCACPAYKIARLDNESRPLYDAVASRGKPVIVSADSPLLRLGADGNRSGYRLFCPKGYPTASSDVHLPIFGNEVHWSFIGLSSHCMDPLLPVAAVARGCALIEMHMQSDTVPSELESNVSLTVSEFRAMIERVRATGVLLG
jgi:sialic acid synthase SpsE